MVNNLETDIDRKFKLTVCVAVLLVCLSFSVFIAHYTIRSDFASLYYAAITILDPDAPNDSMYDIDKTNKYSIPENPGSTYHVFNYSITVGYIISPLALMPYFMAKLVMTFINISMYLAAIAITLQIVGASGRLMPLFQYAGYELNFLSGCPNIGVHRRFLLNPQQDFL